MCSIAGCYLCFICVMRYCIVFFILSSCFSSFYAQNLTSEQKSIVRDLESKLLEGKYYAVIQYPEKNTSKKSKNEDFTFFVKLLSLKSDAYAELGQLDESLSVLSRATNRSKAIGDNYNYAFSLLERAYIYLDIKDFNNAYRDIAVAEKIINDRHLTSLYFNLFSRKGVYYRRTKNIDKSLFYNELALKQSVSRPLKDQVNARMNLSTSFFKANKIAESIHVLQPIKEEAHLKKYKSLKLEIDIQIASIETERLNFNTAEKMFLNCLANADTSASYESKEIIFWGLYSIHKKKKSFKEALFYLEKYQREHTINYKLRQKETLKIWRYKDRLLYRKNRLSKLSQRNKLLVNDRNYQKKMSQTYIQFFSAILLLLVILTIVGYRWQKKKNYLNQEILRSSYEISKINQADEVRTEERKQISREIHDGLGALLASAKMRIEYQYKKSDHTDNQLVESVITDLISACQQVRDLSRRLYSEINSINTLFAAIQDFKIKFLGAIEIEIDLTATENRMVNTVICDHIMSILNEIVHNTVKHSNASLLFIGVVFHDNLLTILIEDDGVGFDKQRITASNKGFGLKSISDRIKILNGDMTLQTNQNTGTQYSITINIK